MFGVGCWMLDVGCWKLVVGCWLLDVGCWMLDVGCWLLDVLPSQTPVEDGRLFPIVIQRRATPDHGAFKIAEWKERGCPHPRDSVFQTVATRMSASALHS